MELRNNINLFGKLNSVVLSNPKATLSLIEFLDELEKNLETINKFDNKFKENNKVNEIISEGKENPEKVEEINKKITEINNKYDKESSEAFSKEIEVKTDFSLDIEELKGFSVNEIRFLKNKGLLKNGE
jgi:hypothetical protein